MLKQDLDGNQVLTSNVNGSIGNPTIVARRSYP